MDHVSGARRSEIMGAVHGKNTTPEITVRRAAYRLGIRFRLHGMLPGQPDLVFKKWMTVVFVNGCFWHRHPGCKRTTVPKTNTAFWEEKFEANSFRDKQNYARLKRMGWKVIVLWQCQVPTIEKAAALLERHFPRVPPGSA